MRTLHLLEALCETRATRSLLGTARHHVLAVALRESSSRHRDAKASQRGFAISLYQSGLLSKRDVQGVTDMLE